ncbi:MAG: hypothetical protein ACLFM6_04480 [Spirochaetaceae bacterium]
MGICIRRHNSIACALALLVFAPLPEADAADDLFSRDGPRNLHDVYIAAGRVFPTAAKPQSRTAQHRLIEELAAIDPDTAAEQERRLDYRDDRLRLSWDLELRPEAYAETNRGSRTFAEVLEREEPFAEFETAYGVDGGPQLVTRSVLQREYRLDPPANYPPPGDGNPVPFENNFIYEGFLHLPGKYLEATIGRQQVHIGPSPDSSLMVSRRVPYLDAARISLSLGRLRMTHLVSSLENRASIQEERAQVPDYPAQPNADDPDGQYAFGKNAILYNVHYFEYALERLRFGIGGQMVVARPMNEFHLGDFFPVFSWHNADLVPHNLAVVVDAAYVAAPGLELYLQAGWDDINADFAGLADSEIPTIPAYLGGLRYTGVLDTVLIEGLLEAGYTHYLWGSFHDEDYLSRAVYRQNTDGDIRSMPLTSPYGPGTVWGTLQGGVEWDSGFGLQLAYRLRAENPEASLYETSYKTSDEVAGTSKRVLHRISARPVFRVTPRMGFYAEPTLVIDDGNVGFEGTFGAALRLSGTRRP